MTLLAINGWVTGVAIPVLLAAGGFIAWVIRSTIEEYKDAERSLSDERRDLYKQLLAPWLEGYLGDMDDPAVVAAQDKMFASIEYKRAMFDMTLVASDEVVRIFGEMTRHSHLMSVEDPSADAAGVIRLWARLLLEIRKSVGNKGTRLKPIDMLRPAIKDIDEHAQAFGLEP